MKLLPESQLSNLNTPRLLNILKRTRTIISAIKHGGCPCGLRYRDCWEEHHRFHSPEMIAAGLKPVEEYFTLLKSMLSAREHIA